MSNMKKEFVLVDKEGNVKFVDETSPEVIKTANHLGVTPEQFLDSQRRGWSSPYSGAIQLYALHRRSRFHTE